MVNDVAAINIDAAVVKSSAGQDDVVELGNGCVCCSSRDQLGETIARFAASGLYDHILVETTGVAEPRGIAALFLQRNLIGRSLNDIARLSSLVTVVDAAYFHQLWTHYEASGAARVRTGSGPKPVFELMIEQVECADLLVLNKVDLVTEADLSAVETILRGLNGRAEVVHAEQGQVSPELLLERTRFEPGETLKAASWIRVLNTLAAPGGGEESTGSVRSQPLVARPGGAPLVAEVPHHETRFGIRSFIFQARRPLLRAKLEDMFDAGVPGLLRAKGFLWIQEQPDEVGFLSFAGGVARYDFLNYWWAALVEHGRARRSEVPPALEPYWQEPFGDRRQELALIGVDLDETSIRKRLEACLV